VPSEKQKTKERVIFITLFDALTTIKEQLFLNENHQLNHNKISQSNSIIENYFIFFYIP